MWSRPFSRVQHPTDVVRTFSPAWLVMSMSTGQFAIQIAAFPYSFTGAKQIGFALWCFNLLLFFVFTLMLLLRVTWLKGEPLLRHPSQSLFLGAAPMALATIIDGMSLLLPDNVIRSAHGAAVVLWWIQVVLVVVVSCLVPYSMVTVQDHTLEEMTVAWAVPILPGVVAASSGGVLAQQCTTTACARDIVLASFALWGMSMMISTFVLTVYFIRLAVYKLQPPEQIPGLILPVGPTGMAALALLLLGTAAPKAFPPAESQPSAAPAAQSLLMPGGFGWIVDYGGTFAAVLFWGAAAWWMLMGMMAIAAKFRQIPFTLGWWGTVFPVGTFTGATLQLWTKLGSQPFRVIGAALEGLLVVQWVAVLLGTLWVGWDGSLFVPSRLLLGPTSGAAATGTSEEELATKAGAESQELQWPEKQSQEDGGARRGSSSAVDRRARGRNRAAAVGDVASLDVA